MLDGEEYVKIVTEYYQFLIDEFEFQILAKNIRGNFFYDVTYRNSKKEISISYENIEDYLSVVVFILKDNELPWFDDKTRTLHLNSMTKSAYSQADKKDIDLNSNFFSSFSSSSKLERELLKKARDLRLSLKFNLGKL